jgi:hypothetical protein
MSKRRIINNTQWITMFSTIALMLPACGHREPPTGEVSGTVTFKGGPLPEGMITFVNAEEGRSGSAAIKDGNYDCPNAPAGECGVEVVVNMPRAAPAHPIDQRKWLGAKMEKARKMGYEVPADAPTDLPPEKSNAVPIPRRYANLKTSGLKLTVIEGVQTYDVPLKP